MTWTIWHNPRCGKSRQTLALLRSHGIEPDIFLYLKTPPSAGELTRVIEKLGISPRLLMRTKETAYKELNLKADRTDAELIDAMVNAPILIERPIVIGPRGAALGRPSENVLSIVPGQ